MGVNYAETPMSSTWTFWDDDPGGASSGKTPEPWDMRIVDGVASFTNCVYRRGPVTLAVTAPDVDMEEGVRYLGARINTETGAVDIMSGGSLSAVTDASTPIDSLYIKFPLYALETTDGKTRRLVDYRKAVNLTLYV